MRDRRSVTPPKIAPTLLGTWVNFGGALEDASYWRGADQIVHLQGAVKNGVIGTNIMNLPSGYRPAALVAFPVESNLAYGRLLIAGNGDVNCDVGNNALVSLSGISFRAAP